MNDVPDKFDELLAFTRQALTSGSSLLLLVATLDGEAKTDATSVIRMPPKLNDPRLALLVAAAQVELALLAKRIANEQRDPRLFLDLLMHCVKIKTKPGAEPPPDDRGGKERTS